MEENMSDDLRAAVEEALGCERDEFIDQEGGRHPFCNEHGFTTGWPCPQAEEVAAAVAPLIEARVREAYREGACDTAATNWTPFSDE